MISRVRVLSCSALVLGAVAGLPSVSAAATCESLSSLSFPDVVSITAKSFAGGTFQPPDPAGFVPTPSRPHANPPISGLPPFCEVSIVVAPAINIEIWLPLPSAWNNRFQGVGGGASGRSASTERSCRSAFVWIWQTLLSVTPRMSPISVSVRPS